MKLFNPGPDTMFNGIFNAPQGLFMTLVISFYQGVFDPKALTVTFINAYCAGVMLTALLRLPAAGAWVCRMLRTKHGSVAEYLVSAGTIGAIMGVLMNTFMTFMAVGPCEVFFYSWWYCIGISILASMVASCLFNRPTRWLVKKRYPIENTEEAG